ncbi:MULTISPECIES: hypothetical protein [Aeromicrobium]|uniref:hypothetical protein n=1 Tax=Aeromicrobium TaxID=2040 RepID=UPI00257F50BD|nr:MULTISPECIES: hypothetical protein [Aeromicrobium]
MTTIGVTGHMGLTAATRVAVSAELAGRLADVPGPLVGYTSLAPGADQIFAWSVLAAGGSVVFVPPCEEIESTIPEANLRQFRAAQSAASEIIPPAHVLPSEQAFFDAGRYIAEHVDLLVAVWDGGPSGGLGGTADIVEIRESSGRPWLRVWPAAASRG